MLTDIATVLCKELREIVFPDGRFQGGARNVVILIGIAGLMLPLQAGPAWFTSWSTVGSACFPLLLVLNYTIDAFAGERERHTLETLLASRLDDRSILLGKTLAIVVYGWAVVATAVPVSVVALNVAHHANGFLFFRTAILAWTLVLAFLLAFLLCAIGVVVSLGAPTVRAAGQRILVPFVAIFLLPTAVPFVLRKIGWEHAAASLSPGAIVLLIAAACLLAACVTLAIGVKRFTRERLVLA